MTQNEKRIGEIILSHMHNVDLYSLVTYSEHFRFYANRLRKVPFYGLTQGREIIKMVCRSAMYDKSLTDEESIIIIKVCHDERMDNILMEVNFNEGWN